MLDSQLSHRDMLIQLRFALIELLRVLLFVDLELSVKNGQFPLMLELLLFESSISLHLGLLMSGVDLLFLVLQLRLHLHRNNLGIGRRTL